MPPHDLIAPITQWAERRFRAFNTETTLLAADWQDDESLALVARLMHAFEARFSRFRADSELTRINAGAGSWQDVSPQMLALLLQCAALSDVTGGIFNPLMLRPLEAAGYDRSFEHVTTLEETLPAPWPTPQFATLEVDHHAGRVRVPAGVGLDFGGIGKGYAVDLALVELPLDRGFLVDAGGDMYARGRASGGEPWIVGVANPLAPDEDIATVSLEDAAIASSWTTKRRWRTGDTWAHHIIDPRTGLPAQSDLAGVTVIAPHAAEADVFAKTALILGSRAGLSFLQQRGVHALLVQHEGRLLRTPGWPGN